MSSHESCSGDASSATPIPRLPAGSRLHRFEQRLDTWWLDQMLSTLIAALNMHDGGTADHSARVAALVVDLAGEVGYTAGSPELEEVRRAALLHDIGKLGIDAAILQKPGSLSDDEWRAMETHPGLGYLMLKDTPPATGHGRDGLRLARALGRRRLPSRAGTRTDSGGRAPADPR